MKYYKITKEYFVLQMKNKSRLEVMEYLEKNLYFSLEKLTFIWNNANKNEYDFYDLMYEYLFSKAKKDEIFENKFNNLIIYFNL